MAALQLLMDPQVELAEPNFLISKDDLTPNDSQFDRQWALRNTGQEGGQFGSDIKATVAWETTTGSSSSVIAVIDSGVDFTHPELIGNRWTNPYPSTQGDRHGWDFVDGTGEIKDEHGPLESVLNGGCGCAGGEVTTVRDERGRRRKFTKDVLGRLKQVGELDWDQSIYATTTYTYSALDQVLNTNQSGQTRSNEYDGYGRLKKQTTPEQGITNYSYRAFTLGYNASVAGQCLLGVIK